MQKEEYLEQRTSMPLVLDFFIADLTFAKYKIEEEDYRKCYHDEAFRNDENLLL